LLEGDVNVGVATSCWRISAKRWQRSDAAAFADQQVVKTVRDELTALLVSMRSRSLLRAAFGVDDRGCRGRQDDDYGQAGEMAHAAWAPADCGVHRRVPPAARNSLRRWRKRWAHRCGRARHGQADGDCARAIKEAKLSASDVIVVDTAGDSTSTMTDERTEHAEEGIAAAEILFIADAMIGQTRAVRGRFHKRLDSPA